MGWGSESRYLLFEYKGASRLARVFSEFDFPASAAELKKHAQDVVDEQEMSVIEKIGDQTYRDMAGVAKEIGWITELSLFDLH